MSDLTWVEKVETVDAIDTTAVDAKMTNPRWRLLATGVGMGSQTTLTFGWPWREGRLVEITDDAPTITFDITFDEDITFGMSHYDKVRMDGATEYWLIEKEGGQQ